MYVDKSQWLLFILCCIITVVSVNVWAAKRDIKLFRELERLEMQEQFDRQYEQEVYKQLPVIPFTN